MFCFFGHRAGGISAPQPGIELSPPALRGKVLTPGPGECLNIFKTGKTPPNSHCINLKKNKQEHAASLLQAFHSFSLCLEPNPLSSRPGVKTPPGWLPSLLQFQPLSPRHPPLCQPTHFRSLQKSLLLFLLG